MLRELRDWAEELACRAGFDGLPSRGGAVAIVVVCVAIGLAAWLWASPADTRADPAPAAPASKAGMESTSAARGPAAAATVTVHVVGQVRRPGVYVLSGGSRAADAVKAAGGLLGGADEAAVNLARVVADGEQLSVPKEGEAPAVATGGAAAPGAAGPPGSGGASKIDLNTATAEQLDTLPGIGPSTAAKIIADRTSSGPFGSVEDLQRVPGIGPSKFEALKDLVTAG
jgi:competence protein ComEA